MNRHWGSDEGGAIQVARVVERSRVLGPGPRAVLAVQGCHLRCRGCTAPGTHRLDGGTRVPVRDLLLRLAAIDDISGITFTGGEPFLQAAALSALLDMLRAERPDFSAMSYSGYRIEWLRRKGSPAQRGLLGRLDLLVDGPYVERQHAPLRWRGSSNQRIHQLSGRHREDLRRSADTTAGMEWTFDAAMNMEWVGVPPKRRFAGAA